MTFRLEDSTAQRFNSISWHDSKLTGLCFYKAGEEERLKLSLKPLGRMVL